MNDTAVTTDVKDMSFESALAELEGIVKQLEAGQGDLENSIKSYERGVVLKQHCEEKLKEAEGKIEKIMVTQSGDVETQPFDLQE